jgi:hypothetical protein
MMFNCVELVTQQLRKFSATFASAVVASSCAKGRCLTDFEPVPSGATAVCITAGGKRRQLAANYQRQKASYCDKFIAASCRLLSLGFEPHFFQTISLGDGVLVQNVFPDGSYQRHFTAGVNIGNCRHS